MFGLQSLNLRMKAATRHQRDASPGEPDATGKLIQYAEVKGQEHSVLTRRWNKLTGTELQVTSPCPVDTHMDRVFRH
ncbi:unnamed protein product [Gadus morhua 'NCC']